jgi:pimeloyl-ACP methyl ester carboxylesterase
MGAGHGGAAAPRVRLREASALVPLRRGTLRAVIDPAALFDRGGAVEPPPRGRLLREAWALLADRPTPADPALLPPGQGRPVLVIPAFLVGDGSTRPLRGVLARCGVRPQGWGLGINWGPTPRLLAGLRRRLGEIRQQEGGAPVALVGISMGGLLARDLAHDRPGDVACVVTLASPFRLPTASSIEPLLRLAARRWAPELRPGRLGLAPPVPTTAVYTRQDGIVAWRSCVPERDGACAAIEVGGAHATICRNPEAQRAVVRALASAFGGGVPGP